MTSKRDATRYIHSIGRNKPESFPTIPDPKNFDAEMKRVGHYLPTPEQIREECRKIRAEKGESEIQEAIFDAAIDAARNADSA